MATGLPYSTKALREKITALEALIAALTERIETLESAGS